MKIAVIGAGKMGSAIIYDLSHHTEISQVALYDIDIEHAEKIATKYGNNKTTAHQLDVSTITEQQNPFIGCQAIISAVTYKYNPKLTHLAIRAGAHFFDLGGNNDVVAEQFKLNQQAKDAGVVIIPDCGLAPGMVSILTAAGLRHFDSVDSVKIRVGGLPQRPHPPLNYQIVFSTEGLLNEYWEPTVILSDGTIKTVAPMTEIETLQFEEFGELEAFYTSGGTSTLPHTYRDKVKFLDYKTIRYPGHCKLFRSMLEIGLASRDPIEVDGKSTTPRSVFREVLNKKLNYDEPDLVLVRVDFNGTKGNQPLQLRYEMIDKADEKTGLSAMMRTTGFPIAIIANMAVNQQIDARGVTPQELAVNPDIFMAELKRRGIKLQTYTTHDNTTCSA